MEDIIRIGSASAALDPAPINPAWILDGNPTARSRLISKHDGTFAVIWDCSAGRFNWFYSVDETVYVIEGSVVLTYSNGVRRRVSAGETIYFPTGSQAEWLVEKYIRKMAFFAPRQPWPVSMLGRAVRTASRVTKSIWTGPLHEAALQPKTLQSK